MRLKLCLNFSAQIPIWEWTWVSVIKKRIIWAREEKSFCRDFKNFWAPNLDPKTLMKWVVTSLSLLCLQAAAQCQQTLLGAKYLLNDLGRRISGHDSLRGSVQGLAQTRDCWLCDLHRVAFWLLLVSRRKLAQFLRVERSNLKLKLQVT